MLWGGFGYFELAAQADVEGHEIRSNAGITACARRPVIGRMAVIVDICPRQQIERTRTVVADNWSKLESAEDFLCRAAVALPRAVEYAGHHNFVSLVAGGEGAF